MHYFFYHEPVVMSSIMSTQKYGQLDWLMKSEYFSYFCYRTQNIEFQYLFCHISGANVVGESSHWKPTK